jgi:hypothetical protein
MSSVIMVPEPIASIRIPYGAGLIAITSQLVDGTL